jgi:hypothetical protein
MPMAMVFVTATRLLAARMQRLATTMHLQRTKVHASTLMATAKSAMEMVESLLKTQMVMAFAMAMRSSAARTLQRATMMHLPLTPGLASSLTATVKYVMATAV